MDQRFAVERAKVQPELAGLGVAGEEFLECQSEFRHRLGGGRLDQRRDFITKAQQATGLKADNRHATGEQGRQRLKRA